MMRTLSFHSPCHSIFTCKNSFFYEFPNVKIQTLPGLKLFGRNPSEFFVFLQIELGLAIKLNHIGQPHNVTIFLIRKDILRRKQFHRPIENKTCFFANLTNKIFPE